MTRPHVAINTMKHARYHNRVFQHRSWFLLITLCLSPWISFNRNNFGGGILLSSGLLFRPPSFPTYFSGSNGGNSRALNAFNKVVHISSSSGSKTNDNQSILLAEQRRVQAAELKKILQQLKAVLLRVPVAAFETTRSSAYSFLTSCAILIPIGLLMHLDKISPVKGWLKLGLNTGVEWAKIGAYYTGGEVLITQLRGVDDDFNTYIGSGLAAALLRYEDGPLGMLQGFAIGFGFMYAIERFFVNNPPPALATNAKNQQPPSNQYSSQRHARMPFSTRTVNHKVPSTTAAATASATTAAAAAGKHSTVVSRGTARAEHFAAASGRQQQQQQQPLQQQQLRSIHLRMRQRPISRSVTKPYSIGGRRHRLPNTPTSSSQQAMMNAVVRRRGQV